MGIIRAAINSVKGGLADSWQEVILLPTDVYSR